jgi:trehalose 6-phosphate phosphatase
LYGALLMSQIAATHDERGWAVFLDVDGTILEIAETPQAVFVPETLKRLLSELCARLDGALALVSGRSIADLDRLFEPLRFCAAGLHGCERRESSGCVTRTAIDVRSLDHARAQLSQLVLKYPELLLEDKGAALALHFRRMPQLQSVVYATCTKVVAELGPQFTLQPGKCVLEIRPGVCSKGAAIEDFMQQTPFRGRTPVFVGDDFTDEDGFAFVNRCSGLSIRVGRPIATFASYWIEEVCDTAAWLRSIPPLETASLRPTVRRNSA